MVKQAAQRVGSQAVGAQGHTAQLRAGDARLAQAAHAASQIAPAALQERLTPRPVQAGLAVGAAGDPLEREAERVADLVMRDQPHATRAAATPQIQRAGMPSAGAALRAPASVERVLAGQGSALAPTLRQDMSQRFGHDFSDVRIHTGEAAASSARDLRARAYTVGSDIVFGEGRFAPEGGEGRRLLAHELTHVVQQSGSVQRMLWRDADPEQGDAVTEEAPEQEGSAVEGAAGVAPPEPPPRPNVRELDYAFVFTGGPYGRAAEAFIRRYYPDHRLIRASSMEEMFDRLFTDTRRPAAGERLHVRELIIVTHANAAGGMQIPLTRGDVARHRFFNLQDADDLQEEFQRGMHQRFEARRHEVVTTVMDADTRVVVRGCEFGQADDALDVLRSMFGGQPMVWAPRAYQGYESIPIGSSFLRTPEEAFDFLVAQDFLPLEMRPAPDEDKRAYIARVFGLHGRIPAEFFVVGQPGHDALAGLIGAGEGISADAEAFKVREPVEVPSLGEYWNLSAPPMQGSDAELDALTLRQIALRAHQLNDPYVPQNACMLKRLQAAWERKVSDLPYLMDYIMDPGPDPLAGMPGDSLGFMQFLQRHFRDAPGLNPLDGLTPESYFGDSNLLAIDAARWPCDTPHEDTFRTEQLDFERHPGADHAAASRFDDPLAIAPPEDATVASAPTEADIAAEERYRRAQDFSKSVRDVAPPALDFSAMSLHELGQQYMEAINSGDTRRLDAVEAEFERRIEDPESSSFGLAAQRGAAPTSPANAGVPRDIALMILRNAAEGRNPFRPELGRVGGVSWFVTEGTPYVGEGRGGEIGIEVELARTEGALVFGETELRQIFEAERARLEPTIEAEFRTRAGIDETTRLSRKMRKNLERLLERASERHMWERVGERVRASPNGVGEVILQGSEFSRGGNGRFAVVADAAKIKLRGGVTRLLETLHGQGVRPDAVLTEAAEEMARRMRWSGRVRGAFHYGGRVLIVVALANDAYQIYTARNRTRAVITSAGGWAGATAAGAAFAAWWTPADAAGPWAWAAHGVGTLVAGGLGYFIGSETTRTIYELVADDEQETE